MRGEADREDDARRDSPSIPAGVRAAGVIWLNLGFLSVVSSCFTYLVLPVLIQAGNRGPKPPGALQPSPTEICGCWLGVLLGVGFFTVGVRLVRGTAKDTLAGSILSLLVGVMYLVLGVGALLAIQNAPPAVVAGAVTAVVIGCLCLLPGVLGLLGRSRYLAWRAAQRPPRRRRRRYADEEDEPDDRPRRRRDRDVRPDDKPGAAPDDER